MNTENTSKLSRAFIKTSSFEINDKPSLGVAAGRILEENGTVGRIQDATRKAAWQRLFNQRRNREAVEQGVGESLTDLEFGTHIVAHFNLSLAKAIKHAEQESFDKGGEALTEVEIEALLDYLGSVQAVKKAFGLIEDKDKPVASKRLEV